MSGVEKKYRGRIWELQEKKYVTVYGDFPGDVTRQFKSMYEKQNDSGHSFSPVCYVDKLGTDNKYVQTMRYDAQRDKDVTKINLIITGAKEEYFKKVNELKEIGNGLVRFDPGNNKWYVTKDMDLKNLPEGVKKYLPKEYQYNYKAIGYASRGKEKSVGYGDSIEDAIRESIKYNKTRTADMKINRCYVHAMNWEKNSLESMDIFVSVDVKTNNFEIRNGESINHEEKPEINQQEKNMLEEPENTEKESEKPKPKTKRTNKSAARVTSGGKKKSQLEADEQKDNKKNEKGVER